MEQHWIYVKTAAGESAMQKRRRLAHRDLRTVLMQVDGVTSVAALKRQIGDANLVESSLGELERLRLIEKRWMPEDGAARGEGAATILTPTAWRRSEPLQADWLTAWRERLALWQRRRQTRRDEKDFLRAYEVNTSEDSFAPVRLKPIRRGRRQRRNWLLRGLGFLLLLAACLALVVTLFPYERYRHDVERHLGNSLGEIVSIGGIGFSYRPYPNITLEGVSIGAACTVAAIRAVPAISSFLGREWVIEHALLEGMTIHRQGIGLSAKWFSGAAGDGIRLRRAVLERLSVEVAGARLGGLNGELKADAAGRVVKVSLHDEAHGLRIDATPSGSGYQLALRGQSVKLPLAPELVFEYLEAWGDVDGDGLRLDRIDGRLFGGGVAASTTLEWSNGGRMLVEATLSSISLNRAAKLAASEFQAEGELSGKFRIEAQAADLAQLADNLHIDGQFATGRGRLDRFDFMEALRTTRSTRGGYTRFEHLSGTSRSTRSGLHLGDLRVDAGALQVTGYLDVSRNQVVKGKVDLDLRGSVIRAKTSATISGDLANPRLQSDRR